MRKSDSDILEAALAYAARGWSLVPIKFTQDGRKRPAVRWTRYQTSPADEGQLRRWFADGKYQALAVVLGPVSGDLSCRDFDKADSYRQWARQFPELASQLPTAKTHRGFHVYFVAELDKTGRFADGELRGARSVCCLPPSPHPKGDRYEWLVSLDGDVPRVDPYQAGLAPQAMQQKRTEENGSRRMQAEATGSNLSAGEDEVELAISATLPTGEGQRNGQVFQLARALKGISDLADADPLALKPIVQRWHARALPHISTKPFEDTWIDFLYGWPRVEQPMRMNLMPDALARAREHPVVGVDYEQTQLRELVGLCRELQALHGEGPFFLSSRTAGRLFGVDHTTAWRWLFLLDQEGWIKTAQRGGGPRTRWKATRFRYLGKKENGEK